jgi:hypothetical protein
MRHLAQPFWLLRGNEGHERKRKTGYENAVRAEDCVGLEAHKGRVWCRPGMLFTNLGRFLSSLMLPGYNVATDHQLQNADSLRSGTYNRNPFSTG